MLSLMATVRLRGQLEKLAGGGSQHEIDGDTVDELLQALESTFSALEGWILDERGVLRRHINVFVNGELATPETAIAASDKIEILPAISGG
jgi:molybdopterin synthase sulfur carrier subunit